MVRQPDLSVEVLPSPIVTSPDWRLGRENPRPEVPHISGGLAKVVIDEPGAVVEEAPHSCLVVIVKIEFITGVVHTEPCLVLSQILESEFQNRR